MIYTAFLNGLLPGRFKFSLAESNVATLGESLRRVQDFTPTTEICVGDVVVRSDNRKRGGEDKGPQADKRPRKDEERIGSFHTTHRSILIKIKGNPMLRQLKPIEALPKFKNKNNYCKYHKDYRHTTCECRELEKALHELAIRDNSIAS